MVKSKGNIFLGFKAVQRLTQAKAEIGFISKKWANDYHQKIEDSLAFIDIAMKLTRLLIKRFEKKS